MRIIVYLCLIILVSCKKNSDLRLHVNEDSVVGKWYYAGTYSNWNSLILDSTTYPEIYFEVKVVDKKTGKFTVDTYYDDKLVRHQLIVDVESEAIFVDGDLVRTHYLDQNHGEHIRTIDLSTDLNFAPDDPSYFFNHDFPNEDLGRNYFVRFTDKQ